MAEESDSWDDIPWISVKHRPPQKKKRTPEEEARRKEKKKNRDLNKVKVPTAYMIRISDDGTKWHSTIDILRPNSPPVEWPEYPHRQTESDFPKGFDWSQVSDLEDDDDPVKILKNLGISETEIAKFEKDYSKRKDKVDSKIEKLRAKQKQLKEEQRARVLTRKVPKLVDDDNLFPEPDDVIFGSMYSYPTTGYGGGVVSRLEDLEDPQKPKEDLRRKEIEKEVNESDFDSGDTDPDVDQKKLMEDFLNM